METEFKQKEIMDYNFEDLTLLIPIKLDSIDRLENLLAVITIYNKLYIKMVIFES